MIERFPQLSTSRLLLRRLVSDDRDALFKLRSSEEVNKYLERPSNITMDDIDAHIKKIDTILLNNEDAYWAISLKDDRTLIGTICLWNFVPEKDKAEIGYELSSDYQGKGLMPEAVAKVIAHSFEQMQLKVITAVSDPRNERSRRLLEKNSFLPDSDYRYVNKEEAGDQAVYFLLNG